MEQKQEQDRRITPRDVREVAKLARLEMDEAKVERLAGQLESIREYVSQVSEVDVAGVEPMAHVLPLKNVLREDEVGPMLDLEGVLRNAPERDGRFFKVPKVIGGDEDSAG